MENDLVTISARIPRKLNNDLEEYASSLGYASKTEVLREMLRNELYGSIGAMKGALKGKVKLKGSMSQWRKEQWQKALKSAKGDVRAAFGIMERDDKEALRGLRLRIHELG